MELLDILNKYNYDETLRNSLEDIYGYVLQSRNDDLKLQFLKCLERTEIILTNDIGVEVDKRYEIPLATKFFLARAKGQYWIMPEILQGDIKRNIFVRVQNLDNLTDEEKENLIHELTHCLRSYGLGEILYNEDSFKVVSGVKKAIVPIVNNKLDMNNLNVKNERLEERFVMFLSKHFDFLSLTSDYIDKIVILLSEELELSEVKDQEKLELYLNMLIIKYFYDGDMFKCFLPKYANFIEEAKKKYDISTVRKFIDVYQSRYNNFEELNELLSLLDNGRTMKSKVV